jgi:hypothetical protein
VKIQALLRAAALATVAIFASAATAAPSGKVRTIDFPAGRSVGTLAVAHFDDFGELSEDFLLGPAAGKVRVPADKLIAFNLNFHGAEDLSFLNKLAPDDLAIINLSNGGRGFEIPDRDYVHLGRLTGLQAVNLEDSEAGSQALQAVGKLPNLIMLNLGTTLIRDDDLKAIAVLKKLRFLDLNYNQLSDAALVHFQGLTELRKFKGRRCGFTGVGMKNFANARHMRYLLIGDNRIGDGLAVLPVLPELEQVEIGDCEAGDRTLVSLSRDLKLTGIYASYGHYSRTGLEALAKLPNLTALSIEGHAIGAADAVALGRAPKLRSAIVTMSPAAVSEAQKSLPHLALIVKDIKRERKQRFIEVLK